MNATPAQRAELVLYRVVRGIVYGIARVYWRLSVSGAEHLPASGPFILAPVHRSNLDTPFVAAVSRRRLRFMGKDSLWRHQPVAWLFSALGGFPVHRATADREALRQSRAVLVGGEPLVVFPEGTRREGPVVQPLFDGAAYLALQLGVPIVPVGIGGSERAMPRGSKGLYPVKVHVEIGAPLVPKSAGDGRHVPRHVVRELTEDLHAELQRLFDIARARAGDA